MTTLEQYAEAAEYFTEQAAALNRHLRLYQTTNAAYSEATTRIDLQYTELAAATFRSLASGETVLCDAEPVAYWCRKHTDGPWYLSANPMPQSDQFVACGSEELPLYAAATQGEP
jgi:hypothetical protein